MEPEAPDREIATAMDDKVKGRMGGKARERKGEGGRESDSTVCLYLCRPGSTSILLNECHKTPPRLINKHWQVSASMLGSGGTPVGEGGRWQLPPFRAEGSGKSMPSVTGPLHKEIVHIGTEMRRTHTHTERERERERKREREEPECVCMENVTTVLLFSNDGLPDLT